MTTTEDRHCRKDLLANQQLHVDLNKALHDAKRLRQRIRRLLAALTDSPETEKTTGRY
jgi:hypothetical protein